MVENSGRGTQNLHIFPMDSLFGVMHPTQNRAQWNEIYNTRTLLYSRYIPGAAKHIECMGVPEIKFLLELACNVISETYYSLIENTYKRSKKILKEA